MCVSPTSFLPPLSACAIWYKVRAISRLLSPQASSIDVLLAFSHEVIAPTIAPCNCAGV